MNLLQPIWFEFRRLGPRMVGLISVLLLLGFFVSTGQGRNRQIDPNPLDVTVIGLKADPRNHEFDPKLRRFKGVLNRIRPNNGFQLLGNSSDRLAKGRQLDCALKNDQTLLVQLLDSLDEDGKVRLKMTLEDAERSTPVFVTEVSVPPNQLVFLEKSLAGSEATLIIGVAAR